MEIAALAILIVFSIVGFLAIFFTTFGTFIIFAGSLLYALMTGFSIIGLKTLFVLFILYLGGEVLEYVFVIMGAKKFGASNAAIVGALVGGFAGAVLGTAFFGIGLIFGALSGVFLGAFMVEFILHRDPIRSLKAGTGSIAGRIGSICVKAAIAVVMFVIMAYNIINNIG